MEREQDHRHHDRSHHFEQALSLFNKNITREMKEKEERQVAFSKRPPRPLRAFEERGDLKRLPRGSQESVHSDLKADYQYQQSLIQKPASLKEEEALRFMRFISVSESDILCLNVGGTKFNCKRSTLTQIKDSFLSAMFSGRWEETHQKDAKGNIYFDWNPDIFIIILNWLRDKTMHPSPPAPSVTPELRQSFLILVAYLGLQHELTIEYLAVPISLPFLKLPRITKNIPPQFTTTDRKSGHGGGNYSHCRTKKEMKTGTYFISVQINGKVFVRITSAVSVSPASSHKLATGNFQLIINCDAKKASVKTLVSPDMRDNDNHNNNHHNNHSNHSNHNHNNGKEEESLLFDGEGPHFLDFNVVYQSSVAILGARHF